MKPRAKRGRYHEVHGFVEGIGCNMLLTVFHLLQSKGDSPSQHGLQTQSVFDEDLQKKIEENERLHIQVGSHIMFILHQCHYFMSTINLLGKPLLCFSFISSTKQMSSTGGKWLSSGHDWRSWRKTLSSTRLLWTDSPQNMWKQLSGCRVTKHV